MLKHIKSSDDWNEKSLGAKGFTLIELLVVIVILGILAAVVVFSVSGVTDRGTSSACKTEAKTVRSAVQAYYAQNGKYPTADTDLTPTFLDQAPQNVKVNYAVSPPTYAWQDGTQNKCATNMTGPNSAP